MSSEPEVDVLLATFNGEKFLRELLNSLRTQVGVKINLLVGDDGSTDSSLAILEEFSESFNSMEIFHFERIGPSRNFLSLLELSKAEYVAFSDQDDVWDSNKLLELVGAIGFAKVPTLAYGKVLPFPGSRKVAPGVTSIPRIIHKNSIQGCNVLFNDHLRKHLLSLNQFSVVMHDWVSVLLCVAIGRVVFVPSAYTFYRLHPDNTIGIPSLIQRMKISLHGTLGGEIPNSIYLQAREVFIYSEHVPDATNIIQIREWLDAVTSTPLKRLAYSSKLMFLGKIRIQDALRISAGLFKSAIDT